MRALASGIRGHIAQTNACRRSTVLLLGGRSGLYGAALVFKRKIGQLSLLYAWNRFAVPCIGANQPT